MYKSISQQYKNLPYTTSYMLTRYQERDLTWIDLVAPTPPEVRALMQEFDLEPKVAQELLSVSHKSKMERSGDTLYVIFHFPTLRLGLNRRPEQEVDFIIGKKFLITTRYENIDPLHSFARAFEAASLIGRPHHTHGGHLFAAMLEGIYRSLDAECELIQGRLEEIETRIFKGDERRMVSELSTVSRVLFDFGRALAPHQDMLTSMEPYATRLLGAEYGYHLRQVEGLRTRVGHTVAGLRESLGELRATNDSLLNAKQNEIMKTFTVLAFVFLPLSFIAGLFGMNTQNNPIVGSGFDFWIIVAGMAFIGLCCFTYFRHKDWL
jgi:magnesium transporter